MITIITEEEEEEIPFIYISYDFSSDVSVVQNWKDAFKTLPFMSGFAVYFIYEMTPEASFHEPKMKRQQKRERTRTLTPRSAVFASVSYCPRGREDAEWLHNPCSDAGVGLRHCSPLDIGTIQCPRYVLIFRGVLGGLRLARGWTAEVSEFESQ
jgi:hypothetical protein